MFNSFFVLAADDPWGSCLIKDPNNLNDVGVPTLKCLEVIFSNVISLAIGFIIIVLFIMFVVGSFQYLTSLGNPERVKKAQGTLKFALIGFILFLGSYLILNTICFLFLGGIGNDCSLMKFELPGP